MTMIRYVHRFTMKRRLRW